MAILKIRDENGQEREIVALKGEPGAGKNLPNNCAVFNDYDNNEILAKCSVGFGTNTMAGYKGFPISQVTLSADSKSMSVVLADKELEEKAYDHYGIGEFVQWDAKNHWYSIFKIVEKSKNADGNTVLRLANSTNEEITHDIALDSDPAENWLWVVGKWVGLPITSQKAITVFGDSNIAAGRSTVVAGRGNQAIGNYSGVVGRNNKAGYAAFVAGKDNNALGMYAFAACSENKALGIYSTVFGEKNTANGARSFVAGGCGSTVDGECSTVFGNGNAVYGKNTYVLGYSIKVYGMNDFVTGDTHIVGRSDLVYQPRQGHVAGSKHRIDTDDSIPSNNNDNYASHFVHVEGRSHTLINAHSAHVEGLGNKIIHSLRAHAEGSYNTIEDGDYSYVGGSYSTVRHPNCFVHGSYLITSSEGQLIFGRYNEAPETAEPDKDVKFAIGVGTSANDRKNAFAVYKDGHAEVRTQGTTTNSVVTKQYVDGLLEQIEQLKQAVRELGGNV